MFPLAPLPCIQVHRPSPNARLRHLAQCILPTATTLNSNPHRKTQNMWRRRRRGEKKKARLSVFTFLKPQKNDTKWRFLSASVSTEIRFLKENCLWSKSKGYGRLLFVKETEKNPFWKSSLFLCSSLPSPLLLRFICLSFLFAPVPLPPFLTASLVNTVHHHSIHPCAEKVRSNDAESAEPFKVETGVEFSFGSVLVQPSPHCISVYTCPFVGQTF